jgi:hypothetical protein
MMNERTQRRRERLDADEPGAPPGFLLDPDDFRTGSHNSRDGTGCAEQVPAVLWDPDGDLLARGGGEET